MLKTFGLPHRYIDVIAPHVEAVDYGIQVPAASVAAELLALGFGSVQSWFSDEAFPEIHCSLKASKILFHSSEE